MSWADKALQKAKIEKLTKEMLNHPEYRRQKAEEDKEMMYRAFACFCLITADYLERHYHCKAQGIRNFIEFVRPSMGYVAGDPDYFCLMNEAIADEAGINVLEEIGLELAEE